MEFWKAGLQSTLPNWMLNLLYPKMSINKHNQTTNNNYATEMKIRVLNKKIAINLQYLCAQNSGT